MTALKFGGKFSKGVYRISGELHKNGVLCKVRTKMEFLSGNENEGQLGDDVLYYGTV